MRDNGKPAVGCIAVLNAGSSSVKFALYEAGDTGALLFRGQVEQLGLAPRMKVVDAEGETVTRRRWTNDQLDHLAPIEAIAEAAPHLPQVACFDTAFHRSQTALAENFALPRDLTAAG